MPYIVLDPALATAIPAGTLGEPLTNVGMTLADLRNELRIMLGGRPETDDPMLDRWINFAYLDTATSLEIDELKGSLSFNSTVAEAMYLLPDVVRAIRHASIIDTANYAAGGRELKLSNIGAYRKAADATGEPREFVRENKLLLLYPTPVAARSITLDVWIRPQKLTDDSDSPILAEEWHEVILKNARAKGHSALREFETAGVTENEHISLVRRKDEPEALEDANRVVGSSVPRTRRQLFSRFTREDRDGLR